MARLKDTLVALDRALSCIMRWIALICFVGLLFLLTGVVFVRFVPIASFGWSDEIVEWGFAWMVFMGAAALWRDNEHFRVKWLETRLTGRKSGKVLALVVETLSVVFIMIMTYYGYKLMVRAHDRSPILELPRHLWYLSVPSAGAIMTGYSIRNLLRHFLELKQNSS